MVHYEMTDIVVIETYNLKIFPIETVTSTLNENWIYLDLYKMKPINGKIYPTETTFNGNLNHYIIKDNLMMQHSALNILSSRNGTSNM